MVRGSDDVLSLTFVDLERSDQGQLLKNTVSVRDSAIATMNMYGNSWFADRMV